VGCLFRSISLPLTVELFEINTEKGHGGPSKNRTTKTPHLRGKLQVMGEAGAGLLGNSPWNTQLAGAGETLVAFGAARGG
jgi:hypothetical protein